MAGAEAALLFDAEGEVVVQAGTRDERHRLIGAYQGIALAAAHRTSLRNAAGEIREVVCRYTWGSVILRPLKDGYYLVVSLSPEASLAQGLRHSDLAQESLNAEL